MLVFLLKMSSVSCSAGINAVVAIAILSMESVTVKAIIAKENSVKSN